MVNNFWLFLVMKKFYVLKINLTYDRRNRYSLPFRMKKYIQKSNQNH